MTEWEQTLALNKCRKELQTLRQERERLKEELEMKRAESAEPTGLSTLAHADHPNSRGTDLAHSSGQSYETIITERDEYWSSRFRANLEVIEMDGAIIAALQQERDSLSRQVKIAVEALESALTDLESCNDGQVDGDPIATVKLVRGYIEQKLAKIAEVSGER